MSKLPLRTKEVHGKGFNPYLFLYQPLVLYLPRRSRKFLQRLQKLLGDFPSSDTHVLNRKKAKTYSGNLSVIVLRRFLPLLLSHRKCVSTQQNHSLKQLPVPRKSPKHINIQKLIELVQSKQQSRNNMPPSHEPPPVRLQINSFMTQKEEDTPYQQKLSHHHTHQDISNDSTATNTIATGCPSYKMVHKLNTKLSEGRKHEPEVYLAKSVLKPAVTACIKNQLKGTAVPMVKLGKTPERTRIGISKLGGDLANAKRNKTPAIRLALIPQPVTNPPPLPLKRYSSKKDITKNLQSITGGGQIRSRNQRPLDNSLIVRTKPEEGNAPLLVSPQQILSNRKENGYEERRSSIVKQNEQIINQMLQSKAHYKTFYEKAPTETEKDKKREPVRYIRLSGFGKDRLNARTSKSIIVDPEPEDKKEEEENIDDSDDCKTVIENNCDNDYSLICNSINGIFPQGGAANYIHVYYILEVSL
eukprot:TRINITY_DN88016_c0_g1_i1.p1 TRINITY_DN88016_c0_g1~~TRINITY_DN88016_c0_g1_i1.p1  ORF type:complete len:472 (-),score=23.65 TRINITY_DN88016_c0_g1_i1:2199-3614(-)